IDKIIEFSECGQFIDTPVKRYSSGMYVKLAFSVAAHLDSEILVMDEVLAVGDIAFQQKCLNKMQEVAEGEGRTILYVSHNMNTVQQLCNRCIVMDHGKIVFDGDVNTAISIYADMSKYMTCYKDYSEEPRKYTKRTDDIYLLSAEYLDKKTASFFRNEKLKLRLKFQNVNDSQKAGLRLEVRTATGTPLCTYLMDDFYKGGKKGTVVTADLDIDLSALAPGSYRTTYTFYYKNEYGSCANVDCVRGLGLEILEGKNENNIKWDAQNWGWIEMTAKPDVKFTEEN
ncbi:MAG: ABC transporter ATP-binding protein, partial [Clostridia bacterium]|nr:ABC transporter ATP-binding protein [Clostridia bacterium]